MDNLKIFLKNGKLSQDVIVFGIFFLIFMAVLIISGIFSILQGSAGFGTGLLIGGAGILFIVSYFVLKWLIYERSNRKIMEEMIEEASHKDALTGLISNTAFRKKIEHTIQDRQLEQDEHLLCIVIGIDRFKDINQSLGYKVGDMVLIEFAKRIKKILSPADIISRLNGDEFAVVSVLKEDDVKFKLNLLKNILSDKYEIKDQNNNGLSVTLSVSVGGSYLDKTSEIVETSDILLKKSQVAMIYSKKQGGGQFSIYTNNMESKNIADLQLENELRDAIPNNELVVHYQPKYSSKTGLIVGAEALVRWYDPRKQKLVPPLQFITIAEDIGIIGEIGKFVLRDACQEIEFWKKAGKDINISVNLSTKQFKEVDLVSSIKEIIECYDIPHKSIELEITESLLMDDINDSVQVLQELRDLGIRISIDDFGTGYSSLAYLKLIPTNTIKIDKSFVNNIESSSKDVAIVSTIIHLAHSLGCDVVAEGVETIEQFEILKQEGCDYVQGYYFCKPLQKTDFRKKIV
jgi:diguanylate cyclase (GGDEF)-like protein